MPTVTGAVTPPLYLPLVDRQKLSKNLNRVRVHTIFGLLSHRLHQAGLYLRGVVSKTIPTVSYHVPNPVVAVGFHRDHLLDVLLTVDRTGQPVKDDPDGGIVTTHQSG